MSLTSWCHPSVLAFSGTKKRKDSDLGLLQLHILVPGRRLGCHILVFMNRPAYGDLWPDTVFGRVVCMYSPRLIDISQFTNFAQVPRTDLLSRFRTSQSRSFRLTFRPRFANSRNSPRFQVGKKQIGALRPAPRTESRCASCWHSHLNRLPIF